MSNIIYGFQWGFGFFMSILFVLAISMMATAIVIWVENRFFRR